jgi:hypothetical protein
MKVGASTRLGSVTFTFLLVPRVTFYFPKDLGSNPDSVAIASEPTVSALLMRLAD